MAGVLLKIVYIYIYHFTSYHFHTTIIHMKKNSKGVGELPPSCVRRRLGLFVMNRDEARIVIRHTPVVQLLFVVFLRHERRRGEGRRGR